MSEHTPGTWKRIALGGSSTVVVPDRPVRNDTRIPAYGYDGSKGHCIGYPFINDDNSIRLDFVCFSHADAVLIAAAPDLLECVQEFLKQGDFSSPHWLGDKARAAIAKATQS